MTYVYSYIIITSTSINNNKMYNTHSENPHFYLITIKLAFIMPRIYFHELSSYCKQAPPTVNTPPPTVNTPPPTVNIPPPTVND